MGSLERELRFPFEVVVVDNASDDDVARVAADFSFVRFFPQQTNLGFGEGNNVGVSHARTHTTVLINPDTYLIDGSISALIEIAASRRELFGPLVLNVDETIQPSCSATPGSLLTSLGFLVPAGALPSRLRLRVHPARSRQTTRVGWLTGVCVVAQTQVLRDLGPFDPEIHMYSEDLELGLRAASGGVPSVFAPEVARIVHVGDASSSKRYSDAGRSLSISIRFAAIARQRSVTRAWIDYLCFVGGLFARVVAKALSRRTSSTDREWLRSALQTRNLNSDYD